MTSNNEEVQRQQKLLQERKIKAMLNIALEPDAYDRMMNVKISNEEFYHMAAQRILAVYQRKGRKLTDKELLSILNLLKGGNKKQGSITFLRK